MKTPFEAKVETRIGDFSLVSKTLDDSQHLMILNVTQIDGHMVPTQLLNCQWNSCDIKRLRLDLFSTMHCEKFSDFI